MWSVSQWMVAGILVSLSVVDIHYRRIPVDMLVLMNAAVVLYQILVRRESILLVAGGAGVGVLFFLISRVTREGIGYGDSWAILILGIYLGLWGILEILAVTFLLLTVAAVFCLARKRMSRKKTIPFYPFLAAGYLVCIVAGGMRL